MGIFRFGEGATADALVDIPGLAVETGYAETSLHAFVTGRRRVGAPPFPEPETTYGRSPVWLLSIAVAWLEETTPPSGPRG